MNITTGPTCVSAAAANGEHISHLSWRVEPDGWYIGFFDCWDRYALRPVLCRFREIWRAADRPTLTFNKLSQGNAAHRFVPRTQLIGD